VPGLSGLLKLLLNLRRTFLESRASSLSLSESWFSDIVKRVVNSLILILPLRLAREVLQLVSTNGVQYVGRYIDHI